MFPIRKARNAVSVILTRERASLPRQFYTRSRLDLLSNNARVVRAHKKYFCFAVWSRLALSVSAKYNDDSMWLLQNWISR